MTLALTVTGTGRSACLRLTGVLDYETAGDFVDAVSRLLDQRPAPAQLRLDLSELTFCDSAGLSGLLFVHRRTGQAGIALHLDHRPRFLDRILDITGTFEHLVGPSSTDAAEGGPVRPDQDVPGETGVR